MTETMLIAIARLMSMPKKVSAGMRTTPPPIPVIAPTSPAISETSSSRGNDIATPASRRDRSRRHSTHQSAIDGADCATGRCAREDHGSVDGVLKLADVTGPRVVHEPLHHIGRNRLDAPAETSSVVRDEVAHQKRDILTPLAKGREIDRKHIQPVVEVGAKLSRRDQLLERTVRRGDDPDVAPDRVRAADPLELLLLEHAKQLRLEVQRQVTDLVEEQGAAVGELEAADPARD